MVVISHFQGIVGKAHSAQKGFISQNLRIFFIKRTDMWLHVLLDLCDYMSTCQLVEDSKVTLSDCNFTILIDLDSWFGTLKKIIVTY